MAVELRAAAIKILHQERFRMPTADESAQLAYDPTEALNVPLEAMGRGTKARKSKSLMPQIELAVVLGLVPVHFRALVELFKKLHAHWHEVQEVDEEGELVWKMKPKLGADGELLGMVPELDEDGDLVPCMVPEVLSDSQVLDLYEGARMWADFHQEQVEHYPSVGGFSTKAALNYDDSPNKQKRKESSASDTQNRQRFR